MSQERWQHTQVSDRQHKSIFEAGFIMKVKCASHEDGVRRVLNKH